MWSLQAHNKLLYWSLLPALLFLDIAALGPGLFSSSSIAINSWQFAIFDVLCHQDPARSYTLSGVQMAVCARCFGIYGALFAGWILLPVYALLKKRGQNIEKGWLIAAILLNLVDVSGNYFGLWTNTLTSRFIMGALFGLPLAFILVHEFFTLNNSE
ncbi:DUF2085 domain-containing protein [Gracilimonas sp.]|uniref:DUF2085 domain-containing protein n=1 Tax=Gracilimonas sp. TaxID=1974203 RepID=UPI003D10D940